MNQISPSPGTCYQGVPLQTVHTLTPLLRSAPPARTRCSCPALLRSAPPPPRDGPTCRGCKDSSTGATRARAPGGHGGLGAGMPAGAKTEGRGRAGDDGECWGIGGVYGPGITGGGGEAGLPPGRDGWAA